MIAKRTVLTVLLLGSWPGSGVAQQPGATDMVGRIETCHDIDARDARLACFDLAAADILNAKRNGEIVVLDRRSVVERRRRAFGLPAASSLAAADVRGAEVKNLTGIVRAVSPTRTPGRFLFKLADGSTWEMLDPVTPPRAGETATITATRLGGFRAKIATRRAVMVKRIR